MQIFQFFVPVWVILVTYVAGMILVGYPMGRLSLKMWKYPEGYPRLLQEQLFPINAGEELVGKLKHTRGLEDGWTNNLPWTMDMFDIHDAIRDNNTDSLAQYLAMQMFVWPFRLTYIVSIRVLFLFLTATFALLAMPAKMLGACKRCVNI